MTKEKFHMTMYVTLGMGKQSGRCVSFSCNAQPVGACAADNFQQKLKKQKTKGRSGL